MKKLLIILLLSPLFSFPQACGPKKKVPYFGAVGVYPEGITGVGLQGGLFFRTFPGVYLGLGAEAMYFEQVKGEGFKEAQAGAQVQLMILPLETEASPVLSVIPGYSTKGFNLYLGAGMAWKGAKLTVGRGMYQAGGRTVSGFSFHLNLFLK